MLPQLGTRPSPSRRSSFSPQAGAAYAAAPPPPVTWTATMTRPQTSAGALERQSSREGNLLSPPTMTYDRPLRDRPLTGQVPRRRPRPSHETDLPSSPRSTIHPAAKVEAWAVTDKAVHEHVILAYNKSHQEKPTWRLVPRLLNLAPRRVWAVLLAATDRLNGEWQCKAEVAVVALILKAAVAQLPAPILAWFWPRLLKLPWCLTAPIRAPPPLPRAYLGF